MRSHIGPIVGYRALVLRLFSEESASCGCGALTVFGGESGTDQA